MKKLTIELTGFGIRLRAARVDDADFILKLRNMPHVKGKMGDLDISLEQEENWLRHNTVDPFDYLFIIESPSFTQLGTISVYNINFQTQTAETGRLAIIPASPAALPACILLTNFCFDHLKMKLLKGYVVSNNKDVLTFNQQLGYKIVSSVQSKRTINGQTVDMVYIELTRDDWKNRCKRLTDLATKGTIFQLQ